MKHFRTLKVVTLVALSMLLLLSLISCGELKVEKFTPVLNSIKTKYNEGEAVDFSGIKVQIQYNDSELDTELTLEDGLKLEYDEDITATAGNKQIKITYECPHTGIKQEATLPILVVVDPNAPKHDRYEVTGMKTEYIVGETLDFTGIKVIEKFTNGGADVEMTDLSSISYTYDAATITATAGTKQIPVTYNGETAGVITITVRYPAVTNTAVSLDGVKTEYLKGETASLAGLSVTLTYENGETRTVDTFTAVSDLTALLTSFGEKEVDVAFTDPISGTGRTASYTIKVDGIVDYTVDATGAKTEYDAGEDVSLDGVIVKANYYFGKTEVVTTGVSFVYADDITNTPGNKKISVTVGGTEVDSFTITVGDIPTLVLGMDGVDLSYRVGETVSLDGLAATVAYKDDASKNFTVSLSDLLYSLDGVTATAGTKKITVTYMLEGEIAITADVSLTVYGISGYDVETDGVKLNYFVGDELNLSGVKVYAKYSDGGERVLIDPSRITFDTAGATDTIGEKIVRVFLDGADAAIGKVTITVVKNTIDKIELSGDYATFFEKGKDILFTGMSVQLTYKNGYAVTVPFEKLSFTGYNKNVLGRQTVTVSFTDEVNGETAYTSFSIVVNEKKTVSQFEEPDEIAEFKTSNGNVGTKQYGDTGFNSQYESKVTYLIGDDNAFTFYPKFKIRDGSEISLVTDGFYSEVTLKVKLNGTYKTLEARLDDVNKPANVSYYDGGTLYAMVDTYFGSYQFTADATNKEISITVMPQATLYDVTGFNPVTLEAKVIDGYNVTEAWQLAVIDNSQSAWASLKFEKGLESISPAAVILHKDIKITADDVPADFLLTLEEDVVYVTKDATGEITATKTIPAGTKYIRDEEFLYVRSGTADFAFEGNFFTLDLRAFPLVPSPGLFKEHDYGSDFSNMTLFYFQHDGVKMNAAPEKMANIVMENFSFLGNAGIDKWEDKGGNLVSAGGVIFMKAVDHTDVTVQNANVTSCFISFFSDFEGYLTIDTVKVYDSYQNALFIWGDYSCEIKDSYFVKAGGPIAIVQSVYHDEINKIAHFNMTNTVTETSLTGEEIWFDAVGARPLVSSQIKPLLQGMEEMAGIGQFITADGKMNVIAALMADTGAGFSDLDALLAKGDLEGYVFANGGGIDRNMGNEFWRNIVTSEAFRAKAGFITVNVGEETIVLVAGENGFFDATGAPFNPQANPTHYAMLEALKTANSFTLSQGGLTVVFGRVE